MARHLQPHPLRALLLFSCIVLTGCPLLSPDQRDWTPGTSEFTEAIKGKSYTTVFTTDAEGTRRLSIIFATEIVSITPRGPENPFGIPIDALSYRLELDATPVEQGHLQLATRATPVSGHVLAQALVSKIRADRMGFVPIEGEDYHLSELQFGLGILGIPTLINAIFRKGYPAPQLSDAFVVDFLHQETP